MRRPLVIALTLGVLSCGASIPLWIPLAKDYRAEQHLAAAREAVAAERWATALFRLQAALNLRPEDAAILAELGPTAAKMDHPETLRYFQVAAERGLLGTDGLVEMVGYGLQSGQAGAMRRWIYALQQTAAEDPRVQALEAQILQMDGRRSEALELADRLLDDPTVRDDVVPVFVRELLGGRPLKAYHQARMKAALLTMAQEAEQKTARYASRVLYEFWGLLEAPEKEQAAAATQAMGELPDQLNLLTRQRQDGAEATDILARGKAAYAAALGAQEADPDGWTGPDARQTMVIWLNRENFHATIFEYLPDALEVQDPAEFFVRQLALIRTGRAASARALCFKRNPLSAARNLVTIALTYQEEGRMDRVRPNLQKAIEQVTPADLDWLEQVLLAADAPDLAIQLFERAQDWTDDPLKMQMRLFGYYSAFQKEREIQRLLPALPLDRLQADSPLAIQALYYSVIYLPDRGRSRRHLEEWVNASPGMLEPRVLLAFSYALMGRQADAAGLVSGWQKPGRPQSRSFAIMLAFIESRSGNLDTARGILAAAGIERDSLFEMERVILNSVI